MSRWRRTIALGVLGARVGEGDRLVARARDVAVALEAADHLVHRRRRELHRPRDVRAGHRQAGLLQPEERLEVLLLGDGGVRRWPCGHRMIRLRAHADRRRARGRWSRAPRAGSGARWPRRWPRAAPRSGSRRARPTSSTRSPPSCPATHHVLACDVADAARSTQAAIDALRRSGRRPRPARRQRRHRPLRPVPRPAARPTRCR